MAPIRVVTKFTWSGSGKLCLWTSTELFYSLNWFFFVQLFLFVVIRASGIVFFVFFSYVFCFISSICFFISRLFSFIILSIHHFLSIIGVMYFEINKSSADMVLKTHSFSISKISFHFPIVWPRRNLGGGMFFVSVSNVRYITGLNLLLLYCPFCFVFCQGFLVKSFWSRSANKIFLNCCIFSGPFVNRNIFSLQ